MGNAHTLLFRLPVGIPGDQAKTIVKGLEAEPWIQCVIPIGEEHFRVLTAPGITDLDRADELRGLIEKLMRGWDMPDLEELDFSQLSRGCTEVDVPVTCFSPTVFASVMNREPWVGSATCARKKDQNCKVMVVHAAMSPVEFRRRVLQIFSKGVEVRVE